MARFAIRWSDESSSAGPVRIEGPPRRHTYPARVDRPAFTPPWGYCWAAEGRPDAPFKPRPELLERDEGSGVPEAPLAATAFVARRAAQPGRGLLRYVLSWGSESGLANRSSQFHYQVSRLHAIAVNRWHFWEYRWYFGGIIRRVQQAPTRLRLAPWARDWREWAGAGSPRRRFLVRPHPCLPRGS